jgi:adenylate cyclase
MAQPRIAWLALLALPAAGFALLVARPGLDVHWQHNPSHFWLVLAAGAVTASLAYATGTAARRRADARVHLVSLAFLAAAGFLGLHALATPGVLLKTSNVGFALATPLGLALAAALAAASSLELGDVSARRLHLVQNILLALLAAWGIVSLTALPKLHDTTAFERASGPLLAVASVGVVLYAVAVVRYLRLFQRRRSPLLLAIAAAFVLLAEAMVAIGYGRNWHASWWEWHVLILAAFLIVALAVHREWHEERFSDLYLKRTSSGTRDISVLFADLQGFTSFSEGSEPEEVTTMLNTYFDVAVPAVERHGGEVDRIIGDALMVTFNTRGDVPDHAMRAVRAALDLQKATRKVAAEHPAWPRFRAGVNSGTASTAVLGTGGGRTYSVIGDTVNLASRVEGLAPAGGVAVAQETADRLDDSFELESIGLVTVKGRAEPIEVKLVSER